MKQMLLLSVLSFMGIAGSFLVSPMWGVAVYYLFAVLRPQFIWEWVEMNGVMLADVPWSFSVAVAALAATFLWRLGVLFPLAALHDPWYGRPRFGRTHYIFLGFAAWITITAYTAIKPETAEKYYWEYAKIFVMVLCATQVLRTIRDVWVIYYVVLGSAIYAGYEINIQYFVDNYQLLNQRGYGGLDNNGGALIVAMAVPMAYFAWEANRRWYRWGFLLAIPVLVHALQLSFSRGGMVALGATAIPVFVRSRHKAFLIATFVLLAGFVVASSGKQLQERFFSISKQEADESAANRLNTWKIAIQMANERPFFGMGVRNSNLFTKQYGADMEGRSIHSQYLQTAADSGWVGAGLYVAMLGSAFLGLWWMRWYTRRFDDPQTVQARSLASGLECATFLFCVGAVFLSLEHFEMPYILLLMAMQLHAIARRISLAPNRQFGPAGPFAAQQPAAGSPARAIPTPSVPARVTT
jgi:probable O-glycosylation ligase (exosortase A-associated)